MSFLKQLSGIWKCPGSGGCFYAARFIWPTSIHRRVFSCTTTKRIQPLQNDGDGDMVVTSQELNSMQIIIPSKEVAPENLPHVRRKTGYKDSEERKPALDMDELSGDTMIEDAGDNLVLDSGSGTGSGTYTDFYQGIIDTYKTYLHRHDGEYVVLVHVGSFYELYFEQAEKYSNLLGLTLTKKVLKSGAIPFSGFPDKMLDKYLDIIYKNNLKAVICNQVLDPITNTLSRPVDRIMTPGIVIDETCRDFHRNNFLMALHFPEEMRKNAENVKVGVAWCDVNLGNFHVLQIELSQLLATLTRINPAEILISDKVDLEKILDGSILPDLMEMKAYYISRLHSPATKKPLDEFTWRFRDNERLVSNIFDGLLQREKMAASIVLHYLDICLPNYKTSFHLPSRSKPKTIMQIDSRAAQDLELLETIQSRKKVGALSHLMDKTVTSPGARRLNSWLLAPSTKIEEIKYRHDLIELFSKDTYFLDLLCQYLRKTADIDRKIRRIDNRKAERLEYLELAYTIETVDQIYNLIKQAFDKKSLPLIEPIFEEFNNSKRLHGLAKHIRKTIDPRVAYMKTSNNKSEGDFVRTFWDIKDTASSRLGKMRKNYESLVRESDNLRNHLQKIFKSEGYNGSLRLIKDPKSFDYVVELKSTSKVITGMIQNLNLNVKEKSKSVTKLVNSQWTNIGQDLIKLEYDICLEENHIMADLDNKVDKLYKEIRKIPPIIELLDVIQSFSRLALQCNLSRPVVDDSDSFTIKNGRHLVVEEGLKNRLDVVNFTPNNCHLESSHAWVITGPNMGGKSTFLRQNALIAIMAQIGSYVPADFAHIGIIDKIFTRVGSSDNIFKHQSTFMVEMNETAIILREATPKSLVIVDELGRGTSINEGVAIAYAALLSLTTVKKSKVLFATHFGPEIARLLNQEETMKGSISFYRTTLDTVPSGDKNVTNKVTFNHKLEKGTSSHSHAIQIAGLAGFPGDVLQNAEISLEKLNNMYR